MVNLFNDYFCSLFTSEDHFIPPPETGSSPSIIDTLVITPQLVSSKLNNLISGKASWNVNFFTLDHITAIGCIF